MNDAHKAFLQAFMSVGVQKAKEVKEVYRKCCEQCAEPYSNEEKERTRQMVEFIRTINNCIQPFHLEVKKGVCEEDGTHFYCLVNNVENAFTLLASDYTANDLEFFKKLVEEIISSDGCVGSRVALNVVERLEKKMTRQDAEILLERLENDRWVLMKEGVVSLSVRSILELNQYIQQVYPDFVKNCNICKLICLKGQACDECGVKIHNHCATRYFRDQDRCPDPDCSAVWTRPAPENDEAGHEPTQDRATRRRRRDDE
ncbi:non-structural maintenance of chromosomes element 1 homolog [Littorina saxatilis]|uniref:Non-structural maintenance of chromosomes element 1 homolog n=1 Tax=Littorina saxatilis TaxID=31220 RepID=A0AAN9B8Y3_9CAEN